MATALSKPAELLVVAYLQDEVMLDLSDTSLRSIPMDFLGAIGAAAVEPGLILEGALGLLDRPGFSSALREIEAQAELAALRDDIVRALSGQLAPDDLRLADWAGALSDLARFAGPGSNDLCRSVSEQLHEFVALYGTVVDDIAEESIDREVAEALRAFVGASSDLGDKSFVVGLSQHYSSTMRELDISFNLLREIPPELLSGTSVSRVDLSNNELFVLPDALRAPPALAELNVSGNKLSSLPQWLSGQATLQNLDASSNQLDEFGVPDLAETRLERIDIGDNRIHELRLELLPATVRVLSAASNPIERITGASPVALASVDLSGCGLRAVPEFLRGTGVTYLDLSSNEISELPVWLAELPLQFLDVQSNELAEIPDVIGDLADGCDVLLGDNPLPDTVIRAANAGTDSVKEYIRSVREQARPCREAKLVLVGEGNVGKTSIVNRLVSDIFRVSQPTTHGIEISQFVLDSAAERPVIFRAWDFGGQRIYRVTHQFYFSQDAIFLVVWRPRDGFEQGGLHYWLDQIQKRVGTRGRVILVSTHADEGRLDHLDLDALKQEFPQLIAGHVRVDSSSAFGFDQLRSLIAEASEELAHINDPIAENWTQLRGRIAATPAPFLTRREIDDEAARLDLVPAATEALLRLLAVLGDVLYYFDERTLSDLVVCDPEILAKAVSYLLEDEKLEQAGGVCTHDEIAATWDAHLGDRLARQMFPFLLRLMERHEISYRIDETRSLLAPLVPHSRLSSKGVAQPGDRILRCEFRFSAEPTGLISWLTVRFADICDGDHWRSGLRLQDSSGTCNVLITATSNSVLVEAAGTYPNELFATVRRDIAHLVAGRWPYLEYDCFIPCTTSGCAGEFRYQRLREAVEVRNTVGCNECFADITIASLLTGFDARESTEVGAQLLDVSSKIDELTAIGRKTLEATDLIRARSGFQADELARVRESMTDIRRAIAFVAADTPRIFSIHPLQRQSIRKAGRHEYRLRLWCEYPNHEHPHGEGYVVKLDKAWFTRAKAVVVILAKVLRLLPVVTSEASTRWDIDGLGLSDQVELMNELSLAAFDLATTSTDTNLSDLRLISALSAQGWEARVLKELLLDVDHDHVFCQLFQVPSVGGEVLWLCQQHRDQLQPGLPTVGAATP